MAVYDPSVIKSGNTLNLEQLITELGSKLPCFAGNASAAALSSASASYVTAASKTISVATDDLIVVAGMMNFSISDGAATIGAMRLYADAANLTNDYFLTDSASNTGGNRSGHTLVWYGENLSGSVAFSVKFARFSGAGTVYTVNSQVAVFQFKKR